MSDKNQPSALVTLLIAGGKVSAGGASNAVGALVGGSIGGPPGAVVGSAAGAVVEYAAKAAGDLVQRRLSEREARRIGTALYYALEESERLKEEPSFRLRKDVADAVSGSTDIHSEILEGALLVARDSYETRRLPYLGCLYARFAYSPDVDPGTAHQVVRLSEALTFRQFCLLRVFDGKPAIALPYQTFRDRPDRIERAPTEAFDPGEPFADLEALLQEAIDLGGRGLIVRRDGTAMLDTSDVAPGGMTLTALGNTTHRLLALDKMGPTEYEEVVALLARPGALAPAARASDART